MIGYAYGGGFTKGILVIEYRVSKEGFYSNVKIRLFDRIVNQIKDFNRLSLFFLNGNSTIF